MPTPMESLVVLKWILALALLTSIGAPLAAAVLPRFPGRGAAFALPAALLPVALCTFWIGQLTFGYHTVVLALILTAGVSALALGRGHYPDWRAVARAFGVFAIGFAFLLAFRVYDPTISQFGGEQFLHFGMVNALERASRLPPEDVWFAGEPMRYYYGSQLHVTVLSLLSGTPPRYGFTLGVPTFYGVLVVSTYGLGSAVVDATGRSGRLGGALSVFFVAVGGASTTAVRLVVGALPEEVAREWGRAAFVGLVENRGTAFDEALTSQGHPEEWGWFVERDVVPGTLQEFPLYSFIKADLHGHTLSTGYVVVAAAIAFAYYRTPAEQRWRRRGLLFGAMGLVAGVFGFMNTWSLPTAVGLGTLAVAAADAHPATLLPDALADGFAGPATDEDVSATGRLVAEAWRLVLGGVLALAVGLVGIALASPFLVFGEVPTNEGVGLLPPPVDVAPWLVIYGGLLALFVGFLVYRGRPASADHHGPLVGIVGAGVVVSLWLVNPVFAVTAPPIAVAWWFVRTDRAGFEAVLLVAGVGLLVSMELVFAKVYHWEQAGARWETSLKVAVQAWTVMGLAAGAIAAVMLSDARRRLAESLSASTGTSANRERLGEIASSLIVAGVVALVVLSSTPFAVLATSSEVVEPLSDPNAEPTIDAFDGHDRDRAAEMEGIYWLDRRDGTPTIVEASVAERDWPGRVSAFTGLPAVLGWSNHEEKFRGADAVDPRRSAVESIYEGSEAESAEALRAYDVRYVFVGDAERELYGDVEARLDDRPGLSIAFENENVTIYAVDGDELVEA